ncbi:hypothetical protein BH11MYX1_BH11MYX1_36380 [soil metagenome]
MDDRTRSLIGRLSPRGRGLALLGLCTAVRAISLFWPCISDDEATYSVVGREMLRGRALYLEIVDHKPPAIYLVNEVCQAIGGPVGGQLVLHALLILAVWGTAMVLARISRRLGSDARTAWIAALLYIVFTTTLIDTDSLAANCELFMMLPLAASVELFLAERFLLAGVLVGVAMLFKYQAGIQLPLFGLTILIRERRLPLQIVAHGVSIAIGCAATIATAAAYLHLHGALDAGWFWFRFNFAYIDTGSSTAKLTAMASRIGLVIAGAAPLYLWAARAAVGHKHRRPHRAFVLGWLAASALAIIVGGRFFGHYFHQVTAPLAVLAAPAAAAFAQRHGRLFIAALAVPAALFFALAAGHEQIMRAAGEPDPDYASVVAYLDAHGTPEDALCVWGNSPVLYFAAARPLGCRFVFSNYITGMSPATPSQTDPDLDSSRNAVPVATQMMIADLAQREPMFFIDASIGNVGFYGKYPPAKFPWLAKILACRYAPEVDIAGMRIYRRLGNPRCN